MLDRRPQVGEKVIRKHNAPSRSYLTAGKTYEIVDYSMRGTPRFNDDDGNYEAILVAEYGHYNFHTQPKGRMDVGRTSKITGTDGFIVEVRVDADGAEALKTFVAAHQDAKLAEARRHAIEDKEAAIAQLRKEIDELKEAE